MAQVLAVLTVVAVLLGLSATGLVAGARGRRARDAERRLSAPPS